MRVSEKDCEYVWFYDWDYSDDTCCLTINLELWDKKPRVIEIPKTIRKNNKAYKVTEVSIWNGYYGDKHKVIVKLPNGVHLKNIYIDNYSIEYID